jgi:hypothetical protein
MTNNKYSFFRQRRAQFEGNLCAQVSAKTKQTMMPYRWLRTQTPSLDI